MIKRYIIITRSKNKSKQFGELLEKLGFEILYCPSIGFSENLSDNDLKKYFPDIYSYDWILFTSVNGVKFFIDAVKRSGGGIKSLKKIQIAAVGEMTARAIKKIGLRVSFVPSRFTSVSLAKEITNVKSKKVLIPGPKINDKYLKIRLEKRGGIITEIPIYKTIYIKNNMKKIFGLINKKQISYLTFTSPSSIEGFLKNIDGKLLNTVLSIPLVSIGPKTTKAAKKYGFKTIFTADIHTTTGMYMKLKKIL